MHARYKPHFVELPRIMILKIENTLLKTIAKIEVGT